MSGKLFEFKRFDYWPCQIVGVEADGRQIIEAIPCPKEDERIDFWSVYGIELDGTAFCIGDFQDEQTAAGLNRHFNDLLDSKHPQAG